MVRSHGTRQRVRRPQKGRYGLIARKPQYSKGAQQKAIYDMIIAAKRIVNILDENGGPGSPSKSTLYRWKHHYEAAEELPYKTAAEKRARFGIDRQNGCRVMTKSVRKKLVEIIMYAPEKYLDEMRDALLAKAGVLVAESTIFKTLQDLYGWSKKTYTAKAAQRDEERRAAFRRDMKEFPDPEVFVWFDETATTRHSFECRRGWCRGGAKVCVSKYFSRSAPFGATLLAAADIHGPIFNMCELVLHKRGDDDDDPTHGTVGCERYAQYVKECVIPNMGPPGGKRSVAVLDNASPHWSEELVRLFQEAGYQIVFLPTYSPDYNPIELVFSKYKNYLKRWYKHGRYNRRLGVLHAEALASITPGDMCGYVRECGCYLNVPGKPSMLLSSKRRAGVLVAVVAALRAKRII